MTEHPKFARILSYLYIYLQALGGFMLNIFLCEDNDKQRAALAEIIEKIVLMEDFDLIFRCSSANPHEILKEAQNISGTGLYFIDIDLKTDMNGLALAQQIRKSDPRGFIVFITTHSEMCYMTFTYKVEAMDFIIKDNWNDMMNRIHQCVVDSYHRYQSPNNREQKTFTITTRDKEYCIPLENILFFETSDNIHKLLLHATDRNIEFTGKIKDLKVKLDDRFYRCHRSYYINRDYIKEIDKKNHTIIMKNQEICLATDKALKELLK